MEKRERSWLSVSNRQDIYSRFWYRFWHWQVSAGRNKIWDSQKLTAIGSRTLKWRRNLEYFHRMRTMKRSGLNAGNIISAIKLICSISNTIWGWNNSLDLDLRLIEGKPRKMITVPRNRHGQIVHEKKGRRKVTSTWWNSVLVEKRSFSKYVRNLGKQRTHEIANKVRMLNEVRMFWVGV